MQEEFTSFIRYYLGPTTEYFSCLGFIIYALAMCRIMTSVLTLATQSLFSRSMGWMSRLVYLGEWAVVTGSTDGIGKAYAEQLAALGLKIVLISRSPEKLAAVAKEIEEAHKVEVRTIAVDFSDNESIYNKIKNELKGLDISILVNNVGMSYHHPEYFVELPNRTETLSSLIKLNVVAMTMMTSIVLPDMVKKNCGVIVNVSSASAGGACPLLTAYSACKAYVKFFSEGLSAEYSDKGIVIQCLMPFYVTTKMSKLRKSSAMVPTPTAYVQSALSNLGISSCTHGYWSHNFLGWFTKTLPMFFVTWYVKNQHLAIRSRALSKQRMKKE